MVSRLTWAPPQMAVGYQPACSTKSGLYPCFPIMPRFGLTGLGRVNPVVPRYGIAGLTFDGTGLFGTGLFSGDITSWGIPEGIAAVIGGYAIYAMFFQAKQTKYRFEAGAQRRRKRRAAKYRAKAKALEEKEVGGLFA